MTFRPTWPRFSLESGLLKSLETVGYKDRRHCINIGCGTRGRYHELLKEFDVDGVDILPIPEGALPWRYHQVDARKLPFEDGLFDLALAVESFEHIDANQEAMVELARVLKPGGRAIITTPTHWTWLFEFGRHGPHYYSRPALAGLVSSSGLKINSITSCGGVATYLLNLTKSWLSPAGMRIFGSFWWKLIDGVLTPFYVIALFLDKLLPFLPVNWVVLAQKKV